MGDLTEEQEKYEIGTVSTSKTGRVKMERL